MNSSSLPPASEGMEDRTRENDRSSDLDDIQETAVSLWVLEQLTRIQKLLEEHGADVEMLDAVEYLIWDNDRWICPEIAARLGSTRTGEA
jgi:hypothetical protein